MNMVLSALGLAKAPMSVLVVYSTVYLTAAVTIAWLADSLLDGGSTGILGNTIIAAIGGLAGLALWAHYGDAAMLPRGVPPVIAPICAATATALSSMIGVGMLRSR